MNYWGTEPTKVEPMKGKCEYRGNAFVTTNVDFWCCKYRKNVYREECYKCLGLNPNEYHTLPLSFVDESHTFKGGVDLSWWAEEGNTVAKRKVDPKKVAKRRQRNRAASKSRKRR
jgi:hypothetical protein